MWKQKSANCANAASELDMMYWVLVQIMKTFCVEALMLIYGVFFCVCVCVYVTVCVCIAYTQYFLFLSGNRMVLLFVSSLCIFSSNI